MQYFVRAMRVWRDGDRTNYQYILFSDETGITHPISVLTPLQLQQLIDGAQEAQRRVSSDREACWRVNTLIDVENDEQPRDLNETD